MASASQERRWTARAADRSPSNRGVHSTRTLRVVFLCRPVLETLLEETGFSKAILKASATWHNDSQAILTGKAIKQLDKLASIAAPWRDGEMRFRPHRSQSELPSVVATRRA
jgi:hypothetical protein